MNLFLLLLLSLPLAAQEYYFAKGMTVGCYNANPLMDISKKGTLAISDEQVILQIKSISCAKDFTMAKLPSLTANGAKGFFLDQKEGVGVVLTEDSKVVLFQKSGSLYEVINAMVGDKKEAKGLSFKDEGAKFQEQINGIEAAIVKAKDAEKAEVAKAKEEATNSKAKQAAEARITEVGEMYKDNVGKVIFIEKYVRKGSTSEDVPSEFVKSFILGEKPLYGRAFYATEDANKGYEVKFTIGNVSVTSEQLRKEKGGPNERYGGGIASAGYWSADILGAFPVVSYDGRLGYEQLGSNYMLGEDAFRILLNKVKSKLIMGSTHTLKMEVLTNPDDSGNQKVIASGNIQMKITAKSQDLLSTICRCQKEGQQNATIEAQAKSLFSTDNNIAKIHDIRLIGRDYETQYSFGKPVSRTMLTECIYTTTDGIPMLWRGTIKFAYTGNGYSTTATWNKAFLSIPLSPTCIK